MNKLQPDLGPLNRVEIHIPNPRRSDFGEMPEAYGAVFCYLVLWQWNQAVKRDISNRAIGEFLGLHEQTVVQALVELQERGFIEAKLIGPVEG
jgi:hypothetical protein